MSKSDEPPAARQPDVFVSYASTDTGIAHDLVGILEQRDIACWIAPRDVMAGASYAEEIIRGITACRWLVLLLSASAVASKHVGKEVERAASKGLSIIPVRLDTTPLTPALEYFLSQSQWVDVGSGGIEAATEKLVAAIKQPAATLTTAGRHDASPHARSLKLGAGRWVVPLGVLGVLVVAAGSFIASRPSSPTRPLAATPASGDIGDAAGIPATRLEKSIAVLPFADMSEQRNQEYFADGMAEEILNNLVKIPGLKVVGRTSAFQFKGKTGDLKSIGRALGAAYVVEGSVRRSGDQLRVTAQLVDSQSGVHRWSETYDRKVQDIFAIQSEIAAIIASQLSLDVDPMGYMTDTTDRPHDVDAYNELLRSLHLADDQQGLEEAGAHIRRAIELDPSYVMAYIALAGNYIGMVSGGYMPTREGFEQARSAVHTALQLNPKSGVAHALLGQIHLRYDWDWAAAAREARIALEHAPRDITVLTLSAFERCALGQWDDAIRISKSLAAADPLDPGIHLFLAQLYQRVGRLADADAEARRGLELSPRGIFGHYIRGRILIDTGESAAALDEFLKETDESTRIAGTALAYYALRRTQEGDAATAALQAQFGGDWPMSLAQIHAFRGRKTEAFSWLERAYAVKDVDLYIIKLDTTLKNLESDARYKAFLRKMNLPI
jgi:TolB-like protein/Tfp pilus assembly protein PilF